MANLASIRAGFTGLLNTYFPDVHCTGYVLANPIAPAFEVELDRIVYDGAMSRGHDEWFFTIRGFSGASTERAAQMRLDSWMNSTGTSSSIKAAIESDRTLGGTVSDARVLTVAKVGVFKFQSAQIELYGAEWTVRVLAAGD